MMEKKDTTLWLDRPNEPGIWYFYDGSTENGSIETIRRRRGTDQLFTVQFQVIHGKWVLNKYRHLNRFSGKWIKRQDIPDTRFKNMSRYRDRPPKPKKVIMNTPQEGSYRILAITGGNIRMCNACDFSVRAETVEWDGKYPGNVRKVYQPQTDAKERMLDHIRKEHPPKD